MPFLDSNWITGIISTLAAIAANSFINRRKSNAEINKLLAETEQIKSNLKTNAEEVQKGVEGVARIDYQLSGNKERIIYNSVGKTNIGFDFLAAPGRTYVKNSQDLYVPDSGYGTGQTTFLKEIIDITRTNTIGRYEVALKAYWIDNKEMTYLPADSLIAGYRRLKISCEAKAHQGIHKLLFVFKVNRTGQWLAKWEYVVSTTEWISIEFHMNISCKEDSLLKIFDYIVGDLPASVQLKNLIISEKDH